MLASPTINRGTAFTLAEREALGLTGLLPTGVSTLDGQLRRVYAQYREQANDLRKWVYLANLRDRNEVLFYRLLSEHIAEMLPVVYTPTVGLAIERFSHEFRRTRGVYLSVDHPEDVETALRNTGLGRRGRRPAGGHRLRGHPRHRRPGRRRHRDLHRQARRLHRRRRHPPAPGAAGGAGHGHRQPETAQRRDVPRRAARPGPRRALRPADRRLRHRVSASCSRTRCCTGRTSAPPTPAASSTSTPTRSARSTTTCRAPRRSCWPRRSPRSARPGRGCATSGSSSTAPAPPAWASPT